MILVCFSLFCVLLSFVLNRNLKAYMLHLDVLIHVRSWLFFCWFFSFSSLILLYSCSSLGLGWWGSWLSERASVFRFLSYCVFLRKDKYLDIFLLLYFSMMTTFFFNSLSCFFVPGYESLLNTDLLDRDGNRIELEQDTKKCRTLCQYVMWSRFVCISNGLLLFFGGGGGQKFKFVDVSFALRFTLSWTFVYVDHPCCYFGWLLTVYPENLFIECSQKQRGFRMAMVCLHSCHYVLLPVISFLPYSLVDLSSSMVSLQRKGTEDQKEENTLYFYLLLVTASFCNLRSDVKKIIIALCSLVLNI